MAIRDFVQRQVVSAAVGTPGVSRSGEILGSAVVSAGQILLQFQARQKRIDDSLEVLDMMNHYESTMLDEMDTIKSVNLNKPEGAIKDYAKVSKIVATSPQFVTGDNRELGLAFRQMTNSVDRNNINNLATWTVRQKNRVTAEKLQNTVLSSADVIGTKVKQGEGIGALLGEINKFKVAQDVAGESEFQQMLNSVKLSNPSVDISKIKTGISETLVTKYVNTQIATNPSLLLGELFDGKFDDIMNQEDITALKKESTNAMTSQSKERFTGAMLTATNQLSAEINSWFDRSVTSPDLGSNEGISDSIQQAEGLRVAVEQETVMLQDHQSKGADVGKALKLNANKLKIIDMYKATLFKTRSTLNKYEITEPKVNTFLEVTTLTNINKLMAEAGDDPDDKYTEPFLNTTMKLMDNFEKGVISKEVFKTAFTLILPSVQEVISNRWNNINHVSEGMGRAFQQIETDMKNFVSKDELDPVGSGTRVTAYVEFWRTYNQRKNEGAIFTTEQLQQLGQHATVLAMLKNGVFPEEDRSLIENSTIGDPANPTYSRIDRAAGIRIIIYKDKQGLYRLKQRGIPGVQSDIQKVERILTPEEKAKRIEFRESLLRESFGEISF